MELRGRRKKICACDMSSVAVHPMVAKFRAQHVEGRHERGKARNTVARLARVKVKRLRRAGLGRGESSFDLQ